MVLHVLYNLRLGASVFNPELGVKLVCKHRGVEVQSVGRVAGLQQFIAQNVVMEGGRDTQAAERRLVGRRWRRKAQLSLLALVLAE